MTPGAQNGLTWAHKLSGVGLPASRQGCRLRAGSGHQVLVGVCVAGQAPAAIGCLSQELPVNSVLTRRRGG